MEHGRGDFLDQKFEPPESRGPSFVDVGAENPPKKKKSKKERKIKPNSKSPGSKNVKVVVRCRPMSEKEMVGGHVSVVNCDLKHGQIEIVNLTRHKVNSTTESKTFSFDKLYDYTKTQQDLYEDVFSPLITSVLDGFNGTIFAYGQTGTGKTYTMEGNLETEFDQGVIPRAFKHIFDHISATPSSKYLVKASYLEIYQEEIRDLLNTRGLISCELREKSEGLYVKDLSSYLCSNSFDIFELMKQGKKSRSVASTEMNEHSSRSHAIFIVTVERLEKTDDGRTMVRMGKLNLVDLAGSERWTKTLSCGQRLKEATRINLSLSSLGNVIKALVEGRTHIPYRDSKLTRLLQDSLGGNSLTVMVATIGPASYNIDETLTTLRYASRAKRIVNRPKINEDPKDAILREYQEEIKRLKELLDEKIRSRTSRPKTASSSNREINDGESRALTPEKLSKLAELLDPLGIPVGSSKGMVFARLEERKAHLSLDKQKQGERTESLKQLIGESDGVIDRSGSILSALEEKIKWLESKVIGGGGGDVQHLFDETERKKALIEEKNLRIDETEKMKENLKGKLGKVGNELVDMKKKLVDYQKEKTDYFGRTNFLHQKLRDIRNKFELALAKKQNSQSDSWTLRVELERERILQKLIYQHFIATPYIHNLEKRVIFGEDKEMFTLGQSPHVLDIESGKFLRRPSPNKKMLFPLYNAFRTRFVDVTACSEYATDENILQLVPISIESKVESLDKIPDDAQIRMVFERALEIVNTPIVIKNIPRSERKVAGEMLRSHLMKKVQKLNYSTHTVDPMGKMRHVRNVIDPLTGVEFQDFVLTSRPTYLPRKSFA